MTWLLIIVSLMGSPAKNSGFYGEPMYPIYQIIPLVPNEWVFSN